MDTQQQRVACRLTMSFLLVYIGALASQIATKKRLLRQASAQGKPFDRYQSPGMLPADRALGNLLEWSPLYLGSLWVLAALRGLQGAALGAAWLYPGLRALYVGLAVLRGVAADGKQKGLYMATVPGYLCLGTMLVQAGRLSWG
eukprot:TRINITY_DN824_c0_g1_i2.p1 TRINITY_DN824_c0_g1~~TRINITY_DN824_c0_g1_i2.p1  ORF type:complete len:144 (+),score=12.93 TRINITY_DN824_c0_g1_i2:38-469(+)